MHKYFLWENLEHASKYASGRLFDLSYIYMRIGREYLLINDFTRASIYYRQATKYFPESLSLQETAAITSYLAGQINIAKKIINKTLKGNPFNSRILFYLGCCLFAEKKWKQAQAAYWRAIKCLPYHPYFPEALNNLALTYIAQNNFEKAEFCLTNALNQKPDYQDAAFNQKLVKGKNLNVNQYRFTRKQFGAIV